MLLGNAKQSSFTTSGQSNKEMDCRQDAEPQPINLAKLDGMTKEEIANNLGLGLSNFERRLKLIRATWEQLL